MAVARTAAISKGEYPMRKFGLIAAAVAATLTAPAHAGNGRVEIVTGLDSIDGEEGVSYGINAGYDFSIGEKAFAGVEVGVADSTVDQGIAKAGRDLSAGVRIGTKTGESGRLYAGVGYTNQRVSAGAFGSANADGVRGSVGYEHNFGTSTYGKIEYRYSNYEAGVDRHQGLIGFGVRF